MREYSIGVLCLSVILRRMNEVTTLGVKPYDAVYTYMQVKEIVPGK